MAVTIKEIAQKVNVSIATVSRALNGDSKVTDKTKDLVLAAAKELEYKPNIVARYLVNKSSKIIGVILPEIIDEFFSSVIKEIDRIAHDDGFNIIVSGSHGRLNGAESIVNFMDRSMVEGLILMAPKLDGEIREVINNSRHPIVLLNSGDAFENSVKISIDNFQGAYASADHLIWHGCKKIGMIKGPSENFEARERYRGFKKALWDKKIKIDQELIVSGDFTIKSGYYGFIRLFSQKKKPEAIFAANDMTAVGIYEAAKSLNIKIPEDVAVVGFDDIFLSRLLNPRLTTIHVPIDELGARAVKYLLKMIKGKADKKLSHKETISTGLVIGGSCGCKNGGSANLI